MDARPVRTKRSPSTNAWALCLCALFAASLAWRLFGLVRLARSPLYGGLDGDSGLYWGWAHLITHGGWVGHNPFFLGPLYPYLLAVLLKLGASSFLAPLVIQCVIGAASTVLVARAARTTCGPSYALAAGGLAAGYAMATYMDLSLLGESLLWGLEAAFLYLQLSDHHERRPDRTAALSGFLIGGVSLGRPSGFLLMLPLAVAATSRRGPRRAARSVGIALACAIAICLPVLVRHLALGHGPILTTYSFGYNAYIGNGPHATGAYSTDVDQAGAGSADAGTFEGGMNGDGRAAILRTTGQRLTPLQSSAWWFARAWQSMTASPGRALRLFGWKALLSVNHGEVWQMDNLHVVERAIGPLGLPAVGGFGVIGVLGLIGLVLQRRSRAGQVLAAHALAMGLPMVMFFVTDRYRLHLALPLLVACGPALESVAALLRTPARWSARLAPVSATLTLVTGLVWAPLVPFDRIQTEFELHRLLGDGLLRSGRIPDAERELGRCLEPAMLAGLPLDRSSSARGSLCGVLHSFAEISAELGDYSGGERALRQALTLTPADRSARCDHALLLALSDHPSEARAECETLGFSPGVLGRDLVVVAERAVRLDAWDRAEHALGAALAVDSTCEAANVVLLRMLRAQGRADEARQLYSRMAGRSIPAAVLERERPEPDAALAEARH